MPRVARQKSPTSIYHIMMRGVNKQKIFNEPKDYFLFLKLIADLGDELDFEVFAYCLMNNHVHLLIRENESSLSSMMRRLGGSYALYFNKKYERVGHLFQGRYKSEPIDSQEYFVTVLRYIHMNPVKAGICEMPGQYPYSSFADYFKNRIVKSDFVEEMLGRKGFKELHLTKEERNESVMDIENQNKRISDAEAARIMKEICGCENPRNFNELDMPSKSNAIATLLRLELNDSQIERITGVSRFTIRKYYK